MLQKLYRYLFWTGYLAVLIMAFMPFGGNISRIKLGPESFHIRLDHLLHFCVYFLICIYYMAGKIIGLYLFSENPLKKFIILLLFLASVTELAQLWVPDRTFSVLDLVSNVAGVFAGVTFISLTKFKVEQGAIKNDQ